MARILDGDIFRRLVRARELIDDAYAEPLALETLARQAGMSPFHFHRLFRQVWGETPHAYVTRVRIERAKRLLARSASVTEACLRVGYLSLGSFSTRFTHAVGCSPQAWQRRVRRLVDVPAQIGRLYIPTCYLGLWITDRKIGETG